METNVIYNESCITGMNQLPVDSIDLCVTSPPYDDLRTYNDSSKWDFNVFKQVASELYRIIKPGGVVVWVVGDAVIKGGESMSSFRQALYFGELGFLLHDTMIYEKNGCAVFNGKIGFFPIPPLRSIKVSYEEDFLIAEALLKLRDKSKDSV